MGGKTPTGLREVTLELFERFTTSWAAGETPDPLDALAKAPVQDRVRLSFLLDRFLAGQPRREPTEESLAYIQQIAELAAAQAAADDAPLLEARVALGLKRHVVVALLRDALGLDVSAEPKLRRYYHRLESGLLDATRVNEKVWAALEGILKWRGDPAHTQPLAATASAFFRASDAPTPPWPAESVSFSARERRDPADWETVDELFLGPRAG